MSASSGATPATAEATRSSQQRIVLTSPSGTSKSLMTTLRFDSKTTVLDLIGLLSEQEGLTNEEAEDYVVRTPDAILSPDVHLRSLSLYSMPYLEHIPRVQCIKFIPQEGNGSAKYLNLDATVPLVQHIPVIASDFGIKEDQLTLVLATIVCSHPAIIFNELLETQANFAISAGIAQMPRAASTTSAGVSLISPSNTLANGASMPELDLSQSLLQQGVRTGAQVQVIRRKRSLMNKILGRRKSLLPAATSKDKASSGDSLSQSPTSGSTSPALNASGSTTAHTDVTYNTQSRFARSSVPFLIKLTAAIESSCIACQDLFSKDFSMSFLLAYKILLDSTDKPYNELEVFGDGSVLGALLRHCLATMSPKLLDPIAFEIGVFADFLAASGTGNALPQSAASQISGLLSKLGADERALLTHWAFLCHEIVEQETTNGYTAERLAQIFAPIFVSPEDSLESSNDSHPRVDQRCAKITASIACFIAMPTSIGESPFKKRSKKDKRLKKNSSYIHHHTSPSSSQGRERAATVTGAESDYSRSDLSTSTSTGSSSKKKDKSSSNSSRATIAGGNYTGSPKDTKSAGKGSTEVKSSPGSKASTTSLASDEPGSPHNLTRSETVSESAGPHEQSEDTAAVNAHLLAQSSNSFMVADFPWSSAMEGDLELRKGDIILVLVSDPQGWNVGRLLTAPGNPVGAFPSTYCSVITKKEVSNMLQLEELSLFESDDASSDDSSSSVSTSSLYQHLVAARMASTSTTSPMGITSAHWAQSPSTPSTTSTSPTTRQSPRSAHTTPLPSPGEAAPSALSPKSPTGKRSTSPSPPAVTGSGASQEAVQPSPQPAPQPIIVDIVARTQLETVNSGSSIDSASSQTSTSRSKLASSSVAIPNPSSAATFIPPLSLSGSESIVTGPDSGRSPHDVHGHLGNMSPASDALGSASPGSSGVNVRSLIVSDLPREREIVKSYSVSTVQSRSDEMASPIGSEPIVALHPAALSATIQDMQQSTTPPPGERRRGSISRSFSQPASQQSPSKSSALIATHTSTLRDEARSNNHQKNVETSPSAARKRVSAAILAADQVAQIKPSVEAERHSKTYPVPPPKGNRHRSVNIESSSHSASSPGSESSSLERRSAPIKKLPLDTIDAHLGDHLSVSSGEQGTSPGSTSSSLGYIYGSSVDRSKPPRSSIAASMGSRSGSSRNRASLPDPILAPLATTGDFFNLSPRTATGDVMQLPPSAGSAERSSFGGTSPVAGSKVPRIPLSTSFRHDHSASWATWAPQGQGHPSQSKISRRLSGPRSPRTHDHPALGRGLSPSGSSRNSPRDRSLLGVQGGLQDEELDRRSQEVHHLQSNVFALEEYNKSMSTTIVEQEMAIERLNRELELLKVAHSMSLMNNNRGLSGNSSNATIGSGSTGVGSGPGSVLSSNSNSGTLSRAEMDGSSDQITPEDQDQPKHQPPRPRKRPSRRISTLPDSMMNGTPLLSGSAPGSPPAPSSPTSSSSPAAVPLPPSESGIVSTSITSPFPTPSIPSTSTPTPVVLPPSPSASPAPSAVAHAPTSPNNLTIQAAALVFAIAFLLWVLQPILLGR